MTSLVLPRLPSGRNPAPVNIDSVPPHRNELEYGLPLTEIGYPSTFPPPLLAMRPRAPANAASATPCRLWSLSTKKHVILQSGGAFPSLLNPPILAGSSEGGPNWHQPTTSVPS